MPCHLTRCDLPQVFPKNKILAVDGIDVFGKTAQEIEDLIAGPQGESNFVEIHAKS